ncbi:MAG: lamin tail domain-containing protein [Bacteroidales bacterium]|nr:lamin tail domain-containing protein [Bacteroidales bacterium]
MRKFLLFPVFLPICLLAQVTEDFSDGDFTQDPAWYGDMNHFKLSSSTAVPEVQRPALQLDAPEAGISTLAYSNQFTGDLEWHFWIKLSLNTSSGNFARVYLLSGAPDLKAPLDGYFLQIGGAEDSVIFFRQDSLDAIRLLCLNSVFTGNSINAVRFKVLRSQDGYWKFYADPAGGHSLEFQGETNDLSFSGGEYFGIFCQYTSSNVSKLYFDDFYTGLLIIDSLPPELLKAVAVSPAEVLLTFSEALDQESAENLSNYEINPALGHPYAAIRLLDPSRVQLFFDQEMQSGITYELSISGIEDLAGNIAGLISRPVLYYQVKPYDVVFTEIMADPTPSVGLPEYEYLEVFNRSTYELDLSGWKLDISSTIHELPSFTLSPGNYLLLCDSNAAAAFNPYGEIIAFSSLVLPNSGASLHLADTAGNTVCYLQYDLSWYKDDLKSDGGWSLEMTNPANPCKNEENWMASGYPSGGTPGKENSVPVNPGDEMKIIKTCCLSDREIEVEFNESLDSLIASETAWYLAEPLFGNPENATPVSPDFRSVRLKFSQGFSTGQVYQLTVHPGMQNCIGEEALISLQTVFALAQPSEPFDIIINEVLFNPLGDGVDYVEIYNRSGKAINLEDLFLASVKESQPEPPDTQSVSITASCSVMLPGQYLVLTADPQKVLNQYYTTDPGSLLALSSFPSYNNDKGYVLLMDRDGLVLDGFHYAEDMHFLMLNSPEGVSLERICPDRLGDDPSNWHSAAETVGFGTPGYENSQFLEMWDDGTSFSIQPEVFSPDGDGWNDQLGIVYDFSSPGKFISVMVFNAEGRLVKTLANNEMPGTHGIYSWDGTLDDRTGAQNGIYIIYMEALGMDGKDRHYKKAAVLARSR